MTRAADAGLWLGAILASLVLHGAFAAALMLVPMRERDQPAATTVTIQSAERVSASEPSPNPVATPVADASKSTAPRSPVAHEVLPAVPSRAEAKPVERAAVAKRAPEAHVLEPTGRGEAVTQVEPQGMAPAIAERNSAVAVEAPEPVPAKSPDVVKAPAEADAKILRVMNDARPVEPAVGGTSLSPVAAEQAPEEPVRPASGERSPVGVSAAARTAPVEIAPSVSASRDVAEVSSGKAEAAPVSPAMVAAPVSQPAEPGTSVVRTPAAAVAADVGTAIVAAPVAPTAPVAPSVSTGSSAQAAQATPLQSVAASRDVAEVSPDVVAATPASPGTVAAAPVASGTVSAPVSQHSEPDTGVASSPVAAVTPDVGAAVVTAPVGPAAPVASSSTLPSAQTGIVAPVVALEPVQDGKIIKPEPESGGEVAMLQPDRPTGPSREDRSKAYGELVRYLAGEKPGDCFLALPSDRDATVRVDGYATRAGPVDQLHDRLGRLIHLPIDLRTHLISQAQCSMLRFGNAMNALSERSLAITLDTPQIVSGSELTGRIDNFRRKRLYLLVIDDEGKVQEVDNLSVTNLGTVRFSSAFTLTDGPVETAQLLLAIASDDALPTIAAHEGDKAEPYFQALLEDIRQRGEAVDLGVAPFLLKARSEPGVDALEN